MKTLLAQLVDGQPLSAEQAVQGFERIMSGQAEPAQTGALLALISQRGPTVDELVGAATVMRQKAVPVAVPEGLTIIDTCGAGGTGSTFFNISTAAALVAAGAGRSLGLGVAKHGNRSVTSRSGSSNVLENLGVNLQAPPEVLTKCLDEAGMCFCYAPAHHPAMKYAGPVRAALGFRTVFNLIGPLTNPAGARRQLVLMQLDASHATAQPGASVMHDGAVVGTVTSGAMGHRTGLNLALAFVTPAHAATGTQTHIDVLGDLIAATVCDPPYTGTP